MSRPRSATVHISNGLEQCYCSREKQQVPHVPHQLFFNSIYIKPAFWM